MNAKKSRLTKLLEDFVRREYFLSLPLLGVRVDHLGEEKSERKIDIFVKLDVQLDEEK